MLVNLHIFAAVFGCILFDKQNRSVIYIGKDFKKDTTQINGQIRDKEVRLIGASGEQVGVVSIAEAMRMAEEADLDLVKIAANATPPVCKIIDYGKYKFEASKKEKENRKNQKVLTIKEIRLSANIGEQDFMVKVNNAIKFLKAGDKVKASIRFRGREITHANLGKVCMDRFADIVSEYGTVEAPAKLEGRSMIMVIGAK